MDSTQVLKALEAELRELDTKKSELARAIETIRRIIVIGSPETASPSRSVMRANMTVEDAAIACLREVRFLRVGVDVADDLCQGDILAAVATAAAPGGRRDRSVSEQIALDLVQSAEGVAFVAVKGPPRPDAKDFAERVVLEAHGCPVPGTLPGQRLSAMELQLAVGPGSAVVVTGRIES